MSIEHSRGGRDPLSIKLQSVIQSTNQLISYNQSINYAWCFAPALLRR